jgi:hypothetical protein
MRNHTPPAVALPPLDMPDPIVIEPEDEAQADEAWRAFRSWQETEPAALVELT